MLVIAPPVVLPRGSQKSCLVPTPPLPQLAPTIPNSARVGLMSQHGVVWMPINQPKRVFLADDDPGLPPQQLKQRLKERRKAARKKLKTEQAVQSTYVPLSVSPSRFRSSIPP